MVAHQRLDIQRGRGGDLRAVDAHAAGVVVRGEPTSRHFSDLVPATLPNGWRDTYSGRARGPWRRHEVYSDGMTRTQIYLSDEELELLGRAQAATGASRSELVRRAIHNTFGPTPKSEKLRALERSAGSWSGVTLTGAEYVDRVRGDLNQRLRHLGLE